MKQQYHFAELNPAYLNELKQLEEHFASLCGHNVILVAYETDHSCLTERIDHS